MTLIIKLVAKEQAEGNHSYTQAEGDNTKETGDAKDAPQKTTGIR